MMYRVNRSMDAGDPVGLVGATGRDWEFDPRGEEGRTRGSFKPHILALLGDISARWCAEDLELDEDGRPGRR